MSSGWSRARRLIGGAPRARGGAPARTRRTRKCRRLKSTTPKTSRRSSSRRTPSVGRPSASLLQSHTHLFSLLYVVHLHKKTNSKHAWCFSFTSRRYELVSLFQRELLRRYRSLSLLLQRTVSPSQLSEYLLFQYYLQYRPKVWTHLLIKCVSLLFSWLFTL